MNNNIQLYNEDDSLNPISNNPFSSSEMYEINGASHEEGGVPMNINQQNVEAEGGETIDFGNSGEARIYGNMKIPNKSMTEILFKKLGLDPSQLKNGYNKKFKDQAKNLSLEEEKLQNNFIKKIEENAVSESNPFFKIAQETQEVNKYILDNKLSEIAKEKESLTTLQKIMHRVSQDLNIDPKDFNKKKYKDQIEQYSPIPEQNLYKESKRLEEQMMLEQMLQQQQMQQAQQQYYSPQPSLSPEEAMLLEQQMQQAPQQQMQQLPQYEDGGTVWKPENTLFDVDQLEKNQIIADQQRFGINTPIVEGPNTHELIDTSGMGVVQNPTINFNSSDLGAAYAQGFSSSSTLTTNQDGDDNIVPDSIDNKEGVNKLLAGLKKYFPELPAASIAGILSNIKQETGFKNKYLTGGDHGNGAKGIVGWRKARWGEVEKYIRDAGLDPATIEGQAFGLAKELKSNYMDTYNKLLSQKDPVEAAIVFHHGFERSGDFDIKANKVLNASAWKNRTEGARDFYRQSTSLNPQYDVVNGVPVFNMKHITEDNLKGYGVEFNRPEDIPKVNPSFLQEVVSAAKLAGFNIKISSAVTRKTHKTASGNSSRHPHGLGLDISAINGVSYSSNKTEFLKLGRQLSNVFKQLGYVPNRESNKNKKSVLFETKGHYDHIHIGYNYPKAKYGMSIPPQRNTMNKDNFIQAYNGYLEGYDPETGNTRRLFPDFRRGINNVIFGTDLSQPRFLSSPASAENPTTINPGTVATESQPNTVQQTIYNQPINTTASTYRHPERKVTYQGEQENIYTPFVRDRYSQGLVGVLPGLNINDKITTTQPRSTTGAYGIQDVDLKKYRALHDFPESLINDIQNREQVRAAQYAYENNLQKYYKQMGIEGQNYHKEGDRYLGFDGLFGGGHLHQYRGIKPIKMTREQYSRLDPNLFSEVQTGQNGKDVLVKVIPSRYLENLGLDGYEKGDFSYYPLFDDPPPLPQESTPTMPYPEVKPFPNYSLSGFPLPMVKGTDDPVKPGDKEEDKKGKKQKRKENILGVLKNLPRLDPSLMMDGLAALTEQADIPPIQQQNVLLQQPTYYSFQDRRNQLNSQLNTMSRMAQNNPAALGALYGNAADQLNNINGEEFRINQEDRNRVYNANHQLINQNEAMNLQLAMQNQQQKDAAIANTRAHIQQRLANMTENYQKRRLEMQTKNLYDNLMRNVKIDKNGRAVVGATDNDLFYNNTSPSSVEGLRLLNNKKEMFQNIMNNPNATLEQRTAATEQYMLALKEEARLKKDKKNEESEEDGQD